MRTLGKTITRPNYLFGLLPRYFKENDNYVPNVVTGYEDNGLLERYLEIFCKEVDLQVGPYIDNVGSLFDAEGLSNLPHSDPTAFLDHIAQLFGNPPYIGTETEYKALLRHIIWIFKTKGTRKSLDLFLAIYGYKVSSLTESSLTANDYDTEPVPIQYDNGAFYDLGFNFYSGWDLVITDLPGTGPKNPSEAWLTKLKTAIQKFISPIFATLNSVTYV